MHKQTVGRSIFLFLSALALSLALATETAHAASDVSGHWAERYIQTMMEKQIIQGYPDGTFRPDNLITREEFAAVLARAKKLPPSASTANTFDDVPRERWSSEYIESLVSSGIIHPQDYGKNFSPNYPITRAEIVVWLVRAAGLEGEIYKNSQLISFSDTMPDWTRGYVTVALNHGLVTGYSDGTFGLFRNATRAEAGLMVLRLLDPKARPAVWQETYVYDAPSGRNTLKVIRVNFNRPDVELRPAMAGKIKDTAWLQEIALNSGAIAAINGTYLSAYSNANGDFGEPYNTLLIDGTWVHFTSAGTTMGITADRQIVMAPVRMTIDGYSNGRPSQWVAWSVNHTSPEAFAVFNKYRGSSVGISGGVTFTVRNGKVVSRNEGDTAIPEDGYVIYFPPNTLNKWVEAALRPGNSVDFRVKFTDHMNNPYYAEPALYRMQHAIGGGPRLVSSGMVTVNPQAEGFTEPKQISLPLNRSAVGVTRDNIVMLVTCTKMTPQEFGEAMLDLGSYNAMQLDGGASSSLWYNGAYLTDPGRKINNALVVITK